MPVERVFLDCREPALVSAARILIERATPNDRELDLSSFLVVTPGGQAGRRLEEILVECAAEHSQPLRPPTVVTAGAMPEQLYRSEQPCADDATQQLAWSAAVADIPRETLTPFFSVLPADDDTLGWLALAEVLQRLHIDFGAQLLDFSDVARLAGVVPTFDEHDRWQMLTYVQSRYLHRLEAIGLCDRQIARRRAVEQRQCQTERKVMLLGAVDLNRTQRAMIDQIADRTTALIFAPKSWSTRFDQYGCVVSSMWREATIDLSTKQIEQVGDPGQQADAVVTALARFNGRYAADEITVGVVDESLVPLIEQRLEESGLHPRYGAGTPLERTSPCQLLAAVAEFIESSRFSSLAALVRHTDVAAWLDRQRLPPDWLTALDEYYGNHLPDQIDGWFAEDKYCTPKVRPVYEVIIELLAPLIDGKRPWNEWSEPIAALLAEIYGGKKFDVHSPIVAACDAIVDCLRKRQQIHAGLAPKLSGREALTLTLRGLRGETIPPRAEPAAIELLGWLELVLDDAPALVVTGFNEEFVPTSRNGDLFLPNDMRRALELEDNDRRFARDAYALAALAASKRDLHVMFGRRNAKGDPLRPSRLLFAADDQTIADRALQWFSAPTEASRIALPGALKAGRAKPNFEIPRPQPLAERVTTMRVTEFKDYIACPYRYYLKHRLGLEPIDDTAEEMNDAQFGNLLHNALEEFGKSELAASTSPDDIEAYLHASVHGYAKKQYGKQPLPTVLIQIEQAKRRLTAFARWQADWCKFGWRIRYVEEDLKKLEDKASLDVDGGQMTLRGRIDRIDFNESLQQWMVLDYKSGDAGREPDKTHRKDGDWIDLQLPLYRHLVTRLNLGGVPKLGYISIPKTVGGVQHQEAHWSDDDLVSADEQARTVVRNIWAENFWPPADIPPAFCEQLAAICQEGQFGSMLCEEETAEAEG